MLGNALKYIAWLLMLIGPGSVHAAAADFVTRRDDGSAIHWSLDRAESNSKQAILLLAQGSGCLAASENPNVATFKKHFATFAVVTIEKYGVSPHAKPVDPVEGCSSDFYANNTLSQRVSDAERVLAAVERSPWWNGQLVLFGGSEGGGMVVMLAPRVKPTAVVVLSSGLGRSFTQIFKLSVPPEVAAQADLKFAEIRSRPESAEVWGGNSYKWWADILRQDFTAALLSTSSPILLIQGDRDRFAPVQVARTTVDEVRAAGRCNLSYWEFPRYGHQMTDVDGESHLEEVLNRASDWVNGNLHRAESKGCT